MRIKLSGGEGGERGDRDGELLAKPGSARRTDTTVTGRDKVTVLYLRNPCVYTSSAKMFLRWFMPNQ